MSERQDSGTSREPFPRETDSAVRGDGSGVIAGHSGRRVTRPTLQGLPLQVPLVGRQEEMAFLRAEFEAIAAGDGGRLLFVTGEPGVGKTRLIQELRSDVLQRQAWFLESRYARAGTMPYGPWIEALRPALQSFDAAELSGLVPAFTVDLAHFFTPHIGRSDTARTRRSAPSENERDRMFDAIAELVLTLSRRTPLIIFLDDLQWAPGISLLAHVARHLAESRALVIGAYRDHEFQEQSHLVRQWADLNRERLCTQISLSSLTHVETGRLLAHYIGSDASTQLHDVVYQKTKGNAFFIEEILRSLAETGVVRRHGLTWEVSEPSQIHIPESMKLTIEERVGRLGQPAQELLSQAAVLGQEFSLRVLHSMSNWLEDDIVEAIDRAVAARLLKDCSLPVEERYAFWDDQVQEVLYEGLTSPLRRGYHREAGSVLESVFADRLDDHLEELARHFTKGHSLNRAADYAYRAAEKNARIHNWTRAGPLYGHAAAILGQAGRTEADQRRRAAALVKQVSVSFNADGPETNLARLAEAKALLEPTGALAAGDDDLSAHLHYWIGRLLVYRLDYHGAIACFQQVLTAAQSADRVELEAVATSSLGRTLVEQGLFAQAGPHLERAAGLLVKTGDEAEWIWNNLFTGLAMAARGQYQTGLVEGRRALSHVYETNNRNLEGPAHYLLALTHVMGGNNRAAVEAAAAAIETSERSGNRMADCFSYATGAWAQSRLGDHSAAVAGLTAYKKFRGRLGEQLVWTDWFTAVETEILLAAGRYAEARSLAESTLALAESVGGVFAVGLAHRICAQALAVVGTAAWDPVERHFTAARQAFASGGAAVEAARAEVAWGILCRDRGDAAGASSHLAEAADRFESVGLGAELARTRQLLSAVQSDLASGRFPGSIKPEPSTEIRPGGLTTRELDVLRLVAAGRTTKEIASELVISVSTVERHITHVYTKIDARSRADATAYAIHHGLIHFHD